MAKVGRKENGQGTIIRLENGKIQCIIETTDQLGNRKRISATADKETEARKKAQNKLKQYKTLIMNNKESEKALATKTLKEVMGGKWFDDYANQHAWTSGTTKSRRNDLAILYNALGSMRLNKITTSAMNDFFTNALTETNRQRLGMVYSIANHFFDDMYNDGILENDIFGRGMKELPSPKKTKKEEYTLEELEEIDFEDTNIKFFTDDEVKKMQSALIQIEFNLKPSYPRLPIYVLMLQTGMRSQEVRALNVDDIDFNNHTIRINKALSTATDKNGKEITVLKSTKTSASNRVIGINAETENLLKRIIKERRNTDKKCKILYCTSTNKWVSKDNFVRDFRKLLRKMDIEPNGRGPHALRHTFASLALEGNDLSPLKGENALKISSYLGHANLEITFRVYAHLDKRKLKEIQYAEPYEVIEIEF